MSWIMRGLLLFAVLIFSSYSLFGQYDSYDFIYNGSSIDEQYSEELIPDYDLFLRPISGGVELFERLSDFNFSFVRYSRRGNPVGLFNSWVDNVSLDNITSRYPNYTIQNVLRRAGMTESSPDLWSDNINNYNFKIKGKRFITNSVYYKEGGRVGLYSTNRKGRGGGEFRFVDVGKRWSFAGSTWFRGGKDRFVDGAFSNRFSFLWQATRLINSRHRVSFTLLGGVEQSSLRSYATKEALELTNNKFYNPSWGYFDDSRRSSRVAVRLEPMALLKYEGKFGSSSEIIATVSYGMGQNRKSALAWYQAESPYPDYYRYMPSYAENPLAAEIIKQEWQKAGERVSQIDWESLYDANKNRKDGSAYVFEDRVEQLSDLKFGLNGLSRFGESNTLIYGARVEMERLHLFKKLKNMLGGKPFRDIDPYLDSYPFNLLQINDLRNPERVVQRGDIFGYNYNINALRYELSIGYSYRGERGGVAVDGAIGQTTLRRDGHYEKELFPGSLSYGESKRSSFSTYSLNLRAEYFIAAGHRLALSGIVESRAQYWGAIFISPEQSNSMVNDLRGVKMMNIEGFYELKHKRVTARITAYYAVSEDEHEIYRYYDDIASKFSNMLLRGVDKKHSGVEFSLIYEVSPKWTISTVAATGRYKFSSNPNVDILEDATQIPHVVGAKSYMKGYRLGSNPETVLSAEIKFSSRGWLATATYSWSGDRHITPNPLWRMERAYLLASSPEGQREFITQTSLPSAGIVRFFILKSFNIRHSRFTAQLSIDNLLDNRKILYDAYEQMRVSRRGIGAGQQYRPFDKKYLYGYGRTYYASLVYNF